MNENESQLRGACRLIEDAVHHGSIIVEQTQKGTAKRTFDILERVPVIAGPSRLVHVIFDASVGLSHRSVRLVNRAVHRVVDFCVDEATTQPK
jgi:hypothetical protein